jgi:calcineurin-like phosphoesterase family protein
MLEGLRREAQRLWRRLAGAETSDAAAGPGRAVLHEVLDPGFLQSQLLQVQEEGAGLLDDSQYQAMFEALKEGQESPVSGAGPEDGGQADLPRSPAISLLQSTLTDCITSRFEDLVKPLPAGERSFAEFALREGDVFRKFGPCDARWIETGIAKGLSLLEGKAKFVDGRAPEVTVGDRATIVVVGDWGTGLPGAQAVGVQMAKQITEAKRKGHDVHALHLGDVYYTGWKEEYRARFMPYWPVRSATEQVPSWALNGNHDMYSAGHGYFGYLLRDPRFAAQQGSSYFCLQTEHWQLLGLDTAYVDSDLAGQQARWVEDKLRASDRKAMLLSHHEPFSAFVGVEPPLVDKLEPAFAVRKVDAWLWGHEHLCCVYQRDLHPYLHFGSCIGHGGVPVLVSDETPAGVSWKFDEYEVHEEEDRWQLFGFAVVDIEGARLVIRYFDQYGRLNQEETIE